MSAPTPCPSCHDPKGTGKYLCPGCWSALSGPTRRALTRRDSKALARLRELHSQLYQRVPLDEIQVTP